MFKKVLNKFVITGLALSLAHQTVTPPKAQGAASVAIAVTTFGAGTVVVLPLLFTMGVGVALTGVGIANFLKDPNPASVWENYRWQVILGIVLLDADSGRFVLPVLTEANTQKLGLNIEDSERQEYNEQRSRIQTFIDSTSAKIAADVYGKKMTVEQYQAYVGKIKLELDNDYLANTTEGARKVVKILLEKEVTLAKK